MMTSLCGSTDAERGARRAAPARAIPGSLSAASSGETLSFDGAKAKCDDLRARPITRCAVALELGRHLRLRGSITWLDAPCNQMQVQVRPTGWVSIVHEPTTNTHFKVDNHNLFRVRWRMAASIPCGRCVCLVQRMGTAAYATSR